MPSVSTSLVPSIRRGGATGSGLHQTGELREGRVVGRSGRRAGEREADRQRDAGQRAAEVRLVRDDAAELQGDREDVEAESLRERLAGFEGALPVRRAASSMPAPDRGAP